MGKSSQEDMGVTGKSCGSPPQCRYPSYSGVIPRGVNNNPAVYPEPGHNPETPSVSTTRSSRTPPRHLPAGLCDGSGSRGRVCSAPALARDGRRVGRRWGRRWGLTCPALTHSETGGGPAAASSHQRPRFRHGGRSCGFSMSPSSGEGGRGPILLARGRGAGRLPSLSRAPMGLSGHDWPGPPPHGRSSTAPARTGALGPLVWPVWDTSGRPGIPL